MSSLELRARRSSTLTHSEHAATDLSDLARFQEAEEHRAELVAAFVHAAFRRSPHAKPLHPVPTTQPVILHYMHGKPPGADSKARPEAQGVSALHTVLVLSRGVWHNDKLYDAKATQAAALLAVQPALSGPSRVVKAAGLSSTLAAARRISAMVPCSEC